MYAEEIIWPEEQRALIAVGIFEKLGIVAGD